MAKIKVIIVDDRDNARYGMMGALQNTELPVELLAAVKSEALLFQALDQDKLIPDVVLLDMQFSGNSRGGIEIAQQIKQKYPKIEIIICSQMKDIDIIVDAFKYGKVKGYVDNSVEDGLASDLKRAIEDALSGKNTLNSPIINAFVENYQLIPAKSSLGLKSEYHLESDDITLIQLFAAGYTVANIQALHSKFGNISKNLNLMMPKKWKRNKKALHVN
ncbi:MAG: response regulator [Bacteroidia bacterium]